MVLQLTLLCIRSCIKVHHDGAQECDQSSVDVRSFLTNGMVHSERQRSNRHVSFSWIAIDSYHSKVERSVPRGSDGAGARRRIRACMLPHDMRRAGTEKPRGYHSGQ